MLFASALDGKKFRAESSDCVLKPNRFIADCIPDLKQHLETKLVVSQEGINQLRDSKQR